MKIKNLLWGLFFIAASALILFNRLGYFPGLTLLNLVLLIIFTPIVIKSLLHFNFGGILFPLAILAIVFDQKLGITELTPWPILFSALFASIGLELIFYRFKKRIWKKRHHNANSENFEEVINCKDDEVIRYHINFSSGIKYVNSDHFKKANLTCSFGALKVYFDNATIQDDYAEIFIDISFAGAELYIPKDWKVITDVHTSLGGIEEKNKGSNESGPTVRLVGNVKFAGVEIIYI